MKKLFCILTVICLLCSVFTCAAVAEEEKAEVAYFADYSCAYDYMSKDVAFAGEYEAVKAEFNVWRFVDEQGEEMVLVAAAGQKKEEIAFRYRGNKRVGLPDNAETIDWTYFCTGRFSDEVLNKIGNIPEEIRNNPNISKGHYDEMYAQYESAEAFVRNRISRETDVAHLTSPYYLLGGWYDLNHDGIFQEIGIDFDGDLIGDLFVNGVGTRGDVNGDNGVDMKDVLSLRKVLAGMGVAAFAPLSADLDSDADITMKDLLMLRQLVVGTITASDLPNMISKATAEKRWNFG